MNQLQFSVRGYHRNLKVTRTIADKADLSEIKPNHIVEDLQYRPRLFDL